MEWHACVVCWKESIFRVRKPSSAYVYIQYLQHTFCWKLPAAWEASWVQVTAPKRFLLAGGLPSYIQGPRSSLNFFIAMDSSTADLTNLSGTLPSHKLYLFLHQRNETIQFRCCRTRDSPSLHGFFSIPLLIALSLWAFGGLIFLLLPLVARETKSHTD